MKTKIDKIIANMGKSTHRKLFFDGGLGTVLQSRGLPTGMLPDIYCVEHPDELVKIHEEYLAAGCNVLTTATFSANRIKLEGTGYNVKTVVDNAIKCAEKAIKISGKDAYIALDIGSCGKLLSPLGTLTFDEAYDIFAEIIKAADERADMIIIETISDTYEAKAALLAAKENSSLPVAVTMIFDENGKLLTGGDIECATVLLSSLGADMIGMNCGVGPAQMCEFLPRMYENTDLPIICNPNADMPRVENGVTVYDMTPDEFANYSQRLATLGAAVTGGCCGTTPAHLKAAVNACKNIPVKLNDSPIPGSVSSYNHAIMFDNKPKIIGERINPTGKAKVKAALREGDFGYIQSEAINQEDAGAHLLDINAGLPEIDEKSTIMRLVCEVQKVSSLPLVIDSSDPSACAAAVRLTNGKPLINSVNGSAESLKNMLPIIKKYGAAAVCLCMDENGIPDTAKGRVAIAKRIIAAAEKCGINKRDLIFDALTVTVSTDKNNAKITLDTVRMLNDLGLSTVLGISNISFGLPERERINAAFLTMAIDAGLKFSIINPSSEGMMSAFSASSALCAHDDDFTNYIARFSNYDSSPESSSIIDGDLRTAVIKGNSSAAEKAVKSLLLTRKGLDIIENELVPALNTVGDGFEKGTVFLPQLLMSADAAKSAFAVINETLGEGSAAKGGKVIMATVRGDVHDIGKNIVTVLLKNYGFDVIDLGRDVAEEKILSAVMENSVKLVGLSALMTTTVVNMESTIKLLRDKCPDVKIMVGGAVMTKTYADMIGADFYSKNAMASVRYAEQLRDENML